MRLFVLVLLCGVANGQAPKNYKDRAEYDLYNETAQDFAANNFSKALMDLDRWREKYPQSEFKDDRQILYVQAYTGANQPAKAIDAADGVLANAGLADHSGNLLRVLYTVVSSIQRVPEATAQQFAIAEKAARLLQAIDVAPDGVNATTWETTRTELHSAARGTLLFIAITPATRAMKANDCGSAETAALKVLQEFPDSAQAAWLLATADVCLSKTDPAKASTALYELARAASLDPAQGMVDKKWQQTTVVPYLEKAYSQFHGPDPQGLTDLMKLALQSPLPPNGFAVSSAAEIAAAKDGEFESQHPQLALWMKIRAALMGADGQHYFESELKDAAIPPLQGVLVEAKPECRPTELRVAIRLPNESNRDAASAPAEVLLKLPKALAGKPEQSEFHWAGVASAFSKEPFLLTMDVDPSKIENLVLSPCQPKPRR